MNDNSTWQPIGVAAARFVAQVDEKRRKPQDNTPPPEPKREIA